MYLFLVLAAFFDGGAYPWGETGGGGYFIVHNMGATAVSEDWFWISYWQGLSAWAGIGLYMVGGSFWKLIEDARRNDESEAVRSAFGLLFILWPGWVSFSGKRLE